MRLLLAFLLMMSPAAAFQVCPQFKAGWTVTSPGPITSISYDESLTLMYVVWNSTQPTAFFGMPVSIMQTISRASNIQQAYQQYVYNKYPSLLLWEQTGCPILTEDGQYISTNGLSLGKPPVPILVTESGTPLITQSNHYFLVQR